MKVAYGKRLTVGRWQVYRSLSILTVVLCFCSAFGYGQAVTPEEVYKKQTIQERPFNEVEWKSIIDGIDYSGKPPKKKEEAKRQQEGQQEGRRRYPSRRSTWEAGGIGAMFMRLLLIILLVALVAVLVRHLLGLEGVSRKKKAVTSGGAVQIDLERIEENIHETDLEQFIRQALEKEDYGLAIRLYYLAILKELSLKKAIKWKKDKTNRDYQRELRGTKLADAFGEVTFIFERAWYGRSRLCESDFKLIEPKFQHFMYAIKR